MQRYLTIATTDSITTYGNSYPLACVQRSMNYSILLSSPFHPAAYIPSSKSHVPLLVLGWGLTNLTDRSYPSHDGNSGMVPKKKKNKNFGSSNHTPSSNCDDV